MGFRLSMTSTSYAEDISWEGCSRDCSERKIVKRDLGIMTEAVWSISLWIRSFLFFRIEC